MGHRNAFTALAIVLAAFAAGVWIGVRPWIVVNYCNVGSIEIHRDAGNGVVATMPEASSDPLVIDRKARPLQKPGRQRFEAARNREAGSAEGARPARSIRPAPPVPPGGMGGMADDFIPARS